MLDDENGKALKTDPLIITYAEKKIKEKVDTSVRSWVLRASVMPAENSYLQRTLVMLRGQSTSF